MDSEDSTIEIGDVVAGGDPSSFSGVPLAPRAGASPEQPRVPCPSCAAGADSGMDPAYVYAVGRIETRIPTLSLEKEIAQATARASTKGKTDREALHAVLAAKENRYLVRGLCWVLTVQGLETYILRPRDPADFDLLVEAIAGPSQIAPCMSLVIGTRGPMAPPEACNGLMVPIVAFDQLYTFDSATLVSAIPRPEKMSEKQFAPAAEELFARIMQMTDNAGATDEHRSLNYLAMRYPAIYAMTCEQFAKDCALSGVSVQRSDLSATRNIVEVVISYTHRNTDHTERFFTRVDVTEEYPFLVSKLAPYYHRT